MESESTMVHGKDIEPSNKLYHRVTENRNKTPSYTTRMTLKNEVDMKFL